jgi:hypothetical protein
MYYINCTLSFGVVGTGGKLGSSQVNAIQPEGRAKRGSSARVEQASKKARQDASAGP